MSAVCTPFAAPSTTSPCDVSTNPPCEHNNWDDVRQRKGIKVLRCRTCAAVWRTQRWPRWARDGMSDEIPDGLRRCLDFANGQCDKGSACPHLHLHRMKSKHQERPALSCASSSVDLLTDATSEASLSPVPTPKASCRPVLSQAPSIAADSEEGSWAWLEDDDDADALREIEPAECAEACEEDLLSLFWQAGLL
eukprot:TRINITY_DN4487_c0_g4_i1.p1 TRINITY_DN4487_c0_g4~~TRINITY_DN4487_c0_g4_i1.p1  ORF type:complete len:194 (+),score=18.81 TRINITY_DN4487_c0_g4_i1:75-656(+)